MGSQSKLVLKNEVAAFPVVAHEVRLHGVGPEVRNIPVNFKLRQVGLPLLLGTLLAQLATHVAEEVGVAVVQI